MSRSADTLRTVNSIEDLLRYLEDELDWPLQGYEPEQLTFEYQPAELGLNDKDAAAIGQILQLRPLEDEQPWGIFFVEFEKKKLPVVVLRRILSHLVVKQRASANNADRARWQAEDLLFISSFGDEDDNQREIAFAHFHQEEGDLPTLRVLGWDGNDTPLKREHVDATLKARLRWPVDPEDHDQWRQLWGTGFRHRIGHVIRTADKLAEEMAALARGIRTRCITMLAAENEQGPLRQLYKAFQTALIHDLKEEDFADTYAQTITYGLLTAAISRTEMSEGSQGTALVAENMTDMVPITNPFLREMLQTFLKVGGRKGGMDFDELGIQDVVELLRGNETDLPAILRDFGNKTRNEDPVIHFYEHFLAAYNKKLKVQRGVFYTPQPVVSYIVRSVHELLQTEFGLEDGLASTVTWGEMAQRHADLKIPKGTEPTSHFVVILDPATGTATFLVEVIDVIYKTLSAKWQKVGKRSAEIQKLWNDYVPTHLLPRLYGYELMMAPYAIAHMKIGLKLFETDYRFGSDERVRIYLTNALEPADELQKKFENMFPALAHEAQAVNEVKDKKRFTVIIGNPPYSKLSGNLTPHARELVESFRYVHGNRVTEKGALALELNLQDDYVKFWAFLLKRFGESGVGIGSYITNSRYLASRSLRGMRWKLCDMFTFGTFLDIGGQISERKVYNTIDENVFDIEQGVAIGLVSKMPNRQSIHEISFDKISGDRIEKQQLLERSTISQLENRVIVEAPFFRFSRNIDDEEYEFNLWPSLERIMPFNSGGIITSRDKLALDFDKENLLNKIDRFANSPKDDKTIENDIGFSVKSKWNIEACKASVRSTANREAYVRRVLYRPFDWRWIYYSTELLDTPSKPVCDSIFDHENLVLLTPGVNTTGEFCHVLVANVPAEKKSCSHDRATQMFPLFRYEQGLFGSQFANIATLKEIELLGTKSPKEMFSYIYGILHSPSYRSRYGGAIRDSYPRIPFIQDKHLFEIIARTGDELTQLHLLEAPLLTGIQSQWNAADGWHYAYQQQSALELTFTGPQQPLVEKQSWTNGTVWLDKAKSLGFHGVPEAVWDFHIGGYKVCEKWLKDRKGRTLNAEDITHYHRIVVSLHETIRLMAEIDQVIEQHGGWPIQ